MDWIKNLIAIAGLYMFATTQAVAATQPDSELRFTILHTNDLHSHDMPFSKNGQLIGGMPRIISLLRDLRSKLRDSLTIDAGDVFQGTLFYTYHHGAIEVKFLNDAAYDIYTIGNHDFDEGPANLATQLEKGKFDIINCNLDASAYPQLAALIKPSIVKIIDGQKVAFIGAVCPNLITVTAQPENIKVINADGDWMSPIRDEILRVKQQGINKIILVTHVGVNRDQLLAQLPDVDVIIGAHSHTRLDKPIIVDHADGSHCAIVQTGCYGQAVGQFDLCFKPDGQLDLDQTHYKLIDITKDLPADPKMTSYLDSESKPFARLSHEILAKAAGRFDNTWQSMLGDSPLGNLVTDALADAGSKYGATIALENRGGMRSGIEQGNISEETVQDLLSYPYTLTICTVKGNELRKILEQGVAGTAPSNSDLSINFLEVHGLKLEWDPKLQPMHRIGKIWAINKTGAFEPLMPDGPYRIAINEHAFNKQGYDFSKATDVLNTGRLVSAYLHDYLLKEKTVTPKHQGRIIPLSTD